MRNIINYNIDFGKIPTDIKKFLYIHNDIYTDLKISKKTENEELVKLENSQIKIEEFWHDELVFTGEKEIDEIINLENIEMQKFLEKNPNFGIFLRKKTAEKILEVDKYFKSQGYYLSLKIGYRPLEVQKKLFETIFSFMKKKKKNLSDEDIYQETIEFISDPNKYISPHTTGGAVDLVLYHENGKLVDMGSPVNFPGKISYLTTDEITKKQKENRAFLADTMISFGFSNLASEWWHFAYGDPYWAKFYGKEEYLYGAIDFN